MPSTAVVRAYRGLLRELWKSSIFHQSARNPIIRSSLRASLLQRMVLRDVENTVAFLRADRNYKALLERYSPLHDLSEEERIKATARRVGLNTPMEYKD
ncbi:hypothetical protein JB92DRAFT_2896299 [Gautieria morchelliformis]|nr:hypothetical protein JB92DRAFT_2896299 [Gautieria morchelliformis]